MKKDMKQRAPQESAEETFVRRVKPEHREFFRMFLCEWLTPNKPSISAAYHVAYRAYLPRDFPMPLSTIYKKVKTLAAFRSVDVTVEPPMIGDHRRTDVTLRLPQGQDDRT